MRCTTYATTNSATLIQCETANAFRVASATDTCIRYPLIVIGTMNSIDQMPLTRFGAPPRYAGTTWLPKTQPIANTATGPSSTCAVIMCGCHGWLTTANGSSLFMKYFIQAKTTPVSAMPSSESCSSATCARDIIAASLR